MNMLGVEILPYCEWGDLKGTGENLKLVQGCAVCPNLPF